MTPPRTWTCLVSLFLSACGTDISVTELPEQSSVTLEAANLDGDAVLHPQLEVLQDQTVLVVQTAVGEAEEPTIMGPEGRIWPTPVDPETDPALAWLRSDIEEGMTFYTFQAADLGLYVVEGQATVKTAGAAPHSAIDRLKVVVDRFKCAASSNLPQGGVIHVGEPADVGASCHWAVLGGAEEPEAGPTITAEGAVVENGTVTAEEEGEPKVTVTCHVDWEPSGTCSTTRSLLALEQAEVDIYWRTTEMPLDQVQGPLVHLDYAGSFDAELSWVLREARSGRVLAEGLKTLVPGVNTLDVAEGLDALAVGDEVAIEGDLLIAGARVASDADYATIVPLQPRVRYRVQLGQAAIKAYGSAFNAMDGSIERTELVVVDLSMIVGDGVILERVGARTSYRLELIDDELVLTTVAFWDMDGDITDETISIPLRAARPEHDVFEVGYVYSSAGIALVAEGAVVNSYGHRPVFDFTYAANEYIANISQLAIGQWYVSDAAEFGPASASRCLAPREDIEVICIDGSSLSADVSWLGPGQYLEPDQPWPVMVREGGRLDILR